MSFGTLNTELQNILLVNHSYLTKWFVFLSITFLSAYYVFVVWKEHSPTKFIITASYRFLLFAISLGYLLSTPLLVLLLTPEYDFLSYYQLPLTLYSIVISILFILFFIDVIRYGPFVLLKMAGLDLKDPKVNEIANALENNKHFLRMNKNKKKSRGKNGR